MTTAQAAFAEANGAEVGPSSLVYRGAVFLYRNEGISTMRWLVGSMGEVIEVSRFRNGGG